LFAQFVLAKSTGSATHRSGTNSTAGFIRRKSMCNRTSFSRNLLFSMMRLLLVAGFTAAALTPAHAIVKFWDGSSSGFWNVAANWTDGIVPVAGDDLVFPPGAVRLVVTNNFSPNRAFRQIVFQGSNYIVRALGANTLILTNGISAQNPVGINTVDADVVLGAVQSIDVLNAPATLDINGDIAMGGFGLTLNNSGTLFLSGAISGTASLLKTGSGTARMDGPGTNTYSGLTRVNAGTLQLFKRFFDGVAFVPVTAIPADLTIAAAAATVQLLDDNQIADTSDVVVVGGLLDLNNFSDRIASLTMTGGTVDSGTGLLTLGGNLTANLAVTTAFINGNLSLGGSSRTFNVLSLAGPGLRINANISGGTVGLATAGFTKTGTGVLWLDGTSTYNGTTVISDGQITISSDRALGATANIFGPAGTTVNGDATLFLVGVAVTNEVLTLNTTNSGFSVGANGVNTWAGDITINSNSIFAVNATSLLIDGAISGPGSFTKNGLGTLTFEGTNANTYAGTTTVNAGTLLLGKTAGLNAVPGDLVIGDGVGGINADVVRLLANTQIANSGDITINASGLLDLDDHSETVGPLTLFEGAITTGIGLLSINGNITATGLPPAPFNGATISGRLNLGGVTRTINTLSGGNAAALTISATISGTAGFTKTGSANLSLTSSNSYTGVTTVADGNLSIGDSDSLGSPAAGNGTIVQNGASLILTGESMVVLENIDLHGMGAATLGALWTANGTTNFCLGVIDLVEDTAIGAVGADGRLTFLNRIAGSAGFTKVADGTVALGGTSDNTYAGATIVNAGTLELAKNGVSIEAIRGSALIIGDGLGGVNVDIVRYVGTSTSQIFSAVPITVNSSGLLDLNGHSDDLGALRLNGGDVHTGAGTASLFGNITATETNGTISFISGHLSLGLTTTVTINPGPDAITPELRIAAGIVGPGGLIKAGEGFLSLSGSNNYAGATTVNDGVLQLEDSFALGSTAAGTVVNSSGSLWMSGGIDVPLEPLTLGSTNSIALRAFGGSNSWAGNITLTANETIDVPTANFLNLAGAITGNFDITKIGAGTLIYSGGSANSYTGNTRVNQGALWLAKSLVDGSIAGDLFIGDGTGGALSDVVRIFNFGQINVNSAVTIATSGLFDLNDLTETVGSISGSGRIDLGSGLLGISGGASTTYAGLIVGTGGISKTGLGILTLTANNTYSGQTLIADGTLRVNGSQPQSRVVVNNNGTLAGDGVVGDVSASGNIAPGASPAVLTSSNLAFTATADFFVELNGPTPGTGYDQLNVRGTNQLGGATLHVSVGFPPGEGDQFTIINNDGSEAIVGTFAGLPNGSVFTADGLQFRILYSDIFLNDVILIVTNTALKATNVTVAAGNGNRAVDPNECNELFIPLRNSSAGLVTNVSGLLSTETPGVIITQPFSQYPNIPASATRTNTLPFQFYTTPAFVCGTNIDFVLTVTTATNGAFQVRFSLPSGSPGANQRFNNSTVLAIPDAATLNSTINVAGITTPIKRVQVLLHITHTADSDLDISLIGPDGTTVILSSDNGGTFSDYGADCTDANRTTFSDLGLTAITSASAPFVGTFRPEQPLSAFNEKFGPDANGIWTLRITDDTAGGLGSLRCWSLIINGTACTPGDGPCETCDQSIAGRIAPSDLRQNNRLTRNGVPSTCAAIKPCPGEVVPNEGIIHYDAYTFTNAGAAACVTVTLTTPCNSTNSGDNFLHSSAYLGSYDPANKCVNYLGDIGNSPSPLGSYSFNVPSDSVFVVIVNEVDSGVGCTNYTLHVSGFDCPQRLEIEPVDASRVALKWSTSAVGYKLLSATDLNGPPPNFAPLAVSPVVTGGKYTVTNTTSGAQRFYELRKP
jgi:autotransporter-associated beta strand protein